MTQFKVNSEYATRSICDSNCFTHHRVNRRTAKSVWIIELRDGEVSGEEKRKSIKLSWDGRCEEVSLGSHSMATSLKADRLSADVQLLNR